MKPVPNITAFNLTKLSHVSVMGILIVPHHSTPPGNNKLNVSDFNKYYRDTAKVSNKRMGWPGLVAHACNSR
jgi:hypothetical protein